MAVDMTQRAWMIVNETITPEEKGHLLGSLVGIVIGGRHPEARFGDRLEAGERDIVYVAPTRMVVVVPKPAADMRLRDLARLAAGDVSCAATILSVPRDDITKVVCPGSFPENFRALGLDDLTFAQLDIIHRRKRQVIDFWVDTDAKPIGAFEDNTHRWLAGLLDDF